MGVVGVSHITLSTADVGVAVRFYCDVLEFEPIAQWPRGAYLVAGDVWVALVLGPSESRQDDYSHIAFHVDRHHFDAVSSRVRSAGAEIWQETGTEGDSLYFTDPDGHRLEIHATTLSERIESALLAPWDGLTVSDRALDLARSTPSVSDPRKPRRLACAPVGVFVVVVDDSSRALFLRNPASRRLEVPNGAMEQGEDPSDTAARELREEAGPISVGPMRCCAALSIDYHPHVTPLLSVGFVCRYQSGSPIAGDDMADCDIEWLRVEEINEDELFIPAQVEILRSAIATLNLNE